MYQLKALFNYDSCPETISHNNFTKNMPKLLKKHKAIHLRPIKDKFDDIEKLFSRNVQDCNLSNFKYIGGAATRKIIESNGIVFSGISPDGKLAEVMEYKDHPWFIGVQYHPELKSTPFNPHPLFNSFVNALINNKKKDE